MIAMAPGIPAFTVLVLVVLSVMPWGVGPSFHFVLPVMPFAAVHFWARAQPHLMPTAFVFAAGLAVDVLSYGPLGYWSLVYLAGLGLTVVLDRIGTRSGLSDWRDFAGVMTGLALAAWLLASAYFVRFIDWQPMAWAALLLALTYPLTQAVLRPLERWVSGPRALKLERRM